MPRSRTFRELAKQLHPDRRRDHRTTEAFKALTCAYGIVGNPTRRREYDEVRRTGVIVEPPPPATRPAPKPPLSVRFLSTRRRARWAIAAGIVLVVAGIVGLGVCVSIQRGEQRQHAATLAASATRVDVGGRRELQFTTASGRELTVPVPAASDDPSGLSAPGTSIPIRYYRDDAHHVLLVADNTARDITFWIVAAKLFGCGVLALAFGVRRMRYA